MSDNETANRRPAASRGRWFRFGLRTLLIMVAFCAVVAAWWRDRSDLRRRLDQSELLRRSTLPPSDERGELEGSLLRELGISESLETAFGGPQPRLLLPPDMPKLLWTSESHTLAELQEILIDRSRRADARCAAVVSLAARQAKEATPLLTAALEFDEPSVRRQAAFALARLRIKAPRAVELLRSEMSAAASPAAAYAGRMLWRIEPALDLVPRFRELLKAEDVETRRWAAYALAFAEHPSAE